MENLSLMEVVQQSSYRVLEEITDPRTLISLASTNRELREQVLEYVTKIEIPDGQKIHENLVFLFPNLRYVRGTIAVSQPSFSVLIDLAIRGPLVLQARASSDAEEKRFYQVFLSVFERRIAQYPTSHAELSVTKMYGSPGFLLGYLPKLGGYSLRLRNSKVLDEKDVSPFIRGATCIELVSGNGGFPPEVYDTIAESAISELRVNDSDHLSRILKRYIQKRKPPSLRTVFFPPEKTLIENIPHSFRYPHPIEFPGYACIYTELIRIEGRFPLIQGSMGLRVRNVYLGHTRYRPADVELVACKPIPLESLTEEKRRVFEKRQANFPTICLIPYQFTWEAAS